MSDLLDRVPATIPGLVQPGVAVYSSRDLLTGRLVEGEAGGLLVWCPTEGDGNVHAFDVGDWDSVDLNDRASRVRAVWWCERHLRFAYVKTQRLRAAQTECAIADALQDLRRIDYVMDLARGGEDMTPKQIDTLARLVLRLAEEVPDV